MKKIFTTLSLGILSGIAVNAQKSVDIALGATVSPSTINVGDSAWIDITITNNGPASLDNTDTIFYTAEGGTAAWSLIPTGTIATGGSQTYERVLYFFDATQNTYAADSTREFCFVLAAQSTITYSIAGGGTRPATVTYTDGNVANDRSCVTVIQKAATTSILNQAKLVKDIHVFPNPASQQLNFAFDFEKSSNAVVRVYDLTGRLVISEDFGKQAAGLQNFTLDVRGLANGNYTVELATDNNKGVSKFVINK